MPEGECARYGEHPKFVCVRLVVVLWLCYVHCVLYFSCVSVSIPRRVKIFIRVLREWIGIEIQMEDKSTEGSR
jgi:hypothetical protein